MTSHDLARLWLEGEDGSQPARMKFHLAILNLMRAKKLSNARIAGIRDHLPREDWNGFARELDAAASLCRLRGSHKLTGAPVDLVAKLFAVPVSGGADATLQLAMDAGIVAGLKKLLVTVGYVAPESDLHFAPVALPTAALSGMTPQFLHDRLVDGIGEMTGQPAARSAMQTFPGSLVKRMNDPLRSRLDMPVVRTLLGVQVGSDDPSGRAGLEALLRGDPAAGKLAERWKAASADLAGTGIAIHPPVPWLQARSEAVFRHVELLTASAIAESGLDLTPPYGASVTAGIELEDGLRIEVMHGARPITRFHVPQDVLPYDTQRLVARLGTLMDIVGAPAEPDAGTPTLH
ncbi:hypothetical protein LAZ40_04365 [Cereibacter sphaeroides]|uniref:hypothetical protein n=1 Tax=Cereibacter sphaeroides TaxID=1063 RepID=UPI001F35AE7B|nr:hypothetical protein [Cereibacter sphaeroides]MCE6958289.1 hypothetical protein [Cereibacter sphaeroides]MCE6971899.1 hypothetical protein [Cereibacter sphaeroides]